MSEGMAMYLQFVWQSETTGTPLEQLLTQAATFERQSRKVNGPPATYDPRTFGEIQVYYGPALMWDEIRRRVGDDAFWEMVRAWPSHDPDGSSNRDDYLPWIEEQTGAELSDLFDGWLFAKRSAESSTSVRSERNRLPLEAADRVWCPHADPGARRQRVPLQGDGGGRGGARARGHVRDARPVGRRARRGSARGLGPRRRRTRRARERGASTPSSTCRASRRRYARPWPPGRPRTGCSSRR